MPAAMKTLSPINRSDRTVLIDIPVSQLNVISQICLTDN